MKNIFSIISYIIIIGAIIFITYIILLLYYPVTVTKPNHQPYKVLTPYIRSGDNLIYQVDACKYIALKATIAAGFVSNIIYPIYIITNNIPTGCRKTDVALPIPMSLPRGKYYLELDITYQINPLRTQTYHFKTESFEVIK